MKKVVITVIAMVFALASGTVRAATLTWTGAVDGNWDAATANWSGGSGIFVDGVDDVIFDNAAGGTINISPNMSPLSTTVSAASGTYTFNGGPIDSGSLTKSGGGTLTLSGTNTYTGGTTVNNGVLSLAAGSSAGSGTITLATGTALALSVGSSMTISNPIVVSSGTATIKQIVAGGPRYVFSGGVTGGTSGSQILNIHQGAGGGNCERTTITMSGVIQDGSGGPLGVSADFKSASLPGQGAFICLSGSNTFTGPIVVNNTVGLIYDGGISTYRGAWFVIGGEITSSFSDRTTAPGTGYLGDGNYTNTISLATGTILNYMSSANQTLGGVISGGGNLVKEGTGILTLSGNNTYTGTTTVVEGTLIGVAGGGCSSSAVTVNNGCILGVRVDDNTNQWTCASLTIGGASTRLGFGFSTTPVTNTAPLNIMNNLVFTGTPVMTIDTVNMTAGTYPLLVYAGTLSGTAPVAATIGQGLTGTLAWGDGVSYSTNTLVLTVSGTGKMPLKWATSASGVWNISTTPNWKDNTGAATNYLDGVVFGEPVVFDDTYVTADTAVALNTIVRPASITVSNLTYKFTISGSGRITGSTVLTKSGANTLTLAVTNTYTGMTTINGGILQLGSNEVLPSGAGKGNMVFSPISGTATLDLNGKAQTINGLTNSGAGLSVVDNSAGSGTLTVGGNDATSTFSGAIRNSGGTLSLAKIGAGVLTLSGINTYSGATTIYGGTLVLAFGKCLSDTALLTISGTGANKLKLNDGVMEKVGSLQLGSTLQPNGTYGSSASKATYKNDTYFSSSGKGVLYVGIDLPPTGTVIVLR